MTQLFVGLISGTSMDGIDAVVVDLEAQPPRVLSAVCRAYPQELHGMLVDLVRAGQGTLDSLGRLDTALGREFALAALEAIAAAGLRPMDVRAIGTHGQTVRHGPGGDLPFTLQLADPNVIAENTGITTVADFRRRDLAAGGQGAPLVPGFYAAVLAHPGHARAVLNLGGIAKLTVLRPGAPPAGFDTGPGNCLLDAWAERHLAARRDEGGGFAARGHVDEPLLSLLLDEPYFHLEPPKSTGREVFNLGWLDGLAGTRMAHLPAADIQATLAELTAATVADSVARHAGDAREVLLCGGGVHNQDLVGRLQRRLKGHMVASIAICGVDPDFVEAMAFAWLAARRLAGQPGNVPQCTGAAGPRIPGAVYPGAEPAR